MSLILRPKWTSKKDDLLYALDSGHYRFDSKGMGIITGSRIYEMMCRSTLTALPQSRIILDIKYTKKTNVIVDTYWI